MALEQVSLDLHLQCHPPSCCLGPVKTVPGLPEGRKEEECFKAELGDANANCAVGMRLCAGCWFSILSRCLQVRFEPH